ncbi:MAG: TlpA disulfide reductase family protein [Candidatus Acidiferrales bacterium]
MHSKPSTSGILAIGVLAAFTIFITWRAKALEKELDIDTDTPALVGQSAPDFSLASLDGRTISLADYRGKKEVVISFWASWCGPCRLEMPSLRKFYKDHEKNQNDFEFLAISIDDERAPAEAFATSEKLGFPVLLDPGGRTASAFGVSAIPVLFVIDRNGKVTYGHIGFEGALEYSLAGELGLREDTATH